LIATWRSTTGRKAPGFTPALCEGCEEALYGVKPGVGVKWKVHRGCRAIHCRRRDACGRRSCRGWRGRSCRWGLPAQRHSDADELVMSMAPHVAADYGSIEDVHGCEQALSRRRTKNATRLGLMSFQAPALAARHVFIAAARKIRCVWADVRWRWTLKVL
jgi:hypothetical protein